MKTANPFKHPFPHANLDNAQLTSIKRLSKAPDGRLPMVGYRMWVGYRSQDDREIYNQMMREKAERDRTG
jgi:hypothetical protein